MDQTTQTTRQDRLTAIRDETEQSAHWIGEQGEFMMFDVDVTYLAGEAGRTVRRCTEHIETLLQERNSLRTLTELADCGTLPVNLALQFKRLAHCQTAPDNTEDDASCAVSCFYNVLYGHAGA